VVLRAQGAKLWISIRKFVLAITLGRLGEFTFMKTQRTLALLWLVLFIAASCYWLWEYLEKCAPAYDGIHARLSLVCLFGSVASIFLFRGAKWARISIGLLAIFFAFAAFQEIWEQGWLRADKWADDSTFVFSLVTIALLFFRKNKSSPTPSPQPPQSGASAS
jgi:hypothetical protein